MAPRLTEYEIAPAHWPKDSEQARALLANYGRFLTASPVGAAGLCLIGYDAELSSLPGKYANKEADLLLARVKGEGAGCVAITERTLDDGMRAAEMKRLWVEPRFRGYGVGRGLVRAAMDWHDRMHAKRWHSIPCMRPCRKQTNSIDRWVFKRPGGSMTIHFREFGSTY
jgi:GNAT superfamily N-acetyltransferase